MDRLHSRRSIRLKEYDYSQAGAYFVILCTHDREYTLGEIESGDVRLSPIGKIARAFWSEIPQHYPNVEIDEFVTMPNHLHGIIVIHGDAVVGVQDFEPLQKNTFQHILPRSIGSILRAYKASVTTRCRTNGYEYFKWQRNYYEHIIRDENSMNRIRKYILNNPLNWATDENNPHNRNVKAAH